MCSPAFIPAGIGALGGLLQGNAQVSQAKAQAAALRQNALYLNNAAADARVRGMIDSDWKRVEGQAVIGSQRAAMAANGGLVDQDTNALLQQDTAQLTEWDALVISNNAAREAYGYEVQAADNLATAKNAVKAARQNRIASVLGGAVQGGMQAYAAGMFGSGGVGAGTQAAKTGGTTRLNNNQAYA